MGDQSNEVKAPNIGDKNFISSRYLANFNIFLKIDKWVEDDKLGYFDPIDLCNWEDKMDKDIASVLYQTEDLINLRKGLAQSGIKKRDPPKFSGSVLDYPLFKKNWSIEINPVGLPELIELNYLKDSVPF